MKPKKRPCPPFDKTQHLADGYALLSENFYVGVKNCEVYSRINPAKDRWEYQLACRDDDQKNVWHLNFDEPTDAAPGVAYFVDLLLKGGFLKRKPGFDVEWAINVNDCNDYPSNFPSQELCDRAVLELCISGEKDLIHDTACTFRLQPNGDQHQHIYQELIGAVVQDKLLAMDWNPSVKFALAAWLGNEEHITEALRAGASPNTSVGPEGLTALHLSAKEGWQGAVDMLLRAGADPCVKDHHGNSPLHVAAMGGVRQICAAFLQEENLLSRNASGKTPLDMALQVRDNPVESLLRAALARLSAAAAMREIPSMKP